MIATRKFRRRPGRAAKSNFVILTFASPTTLSGGRSKRGLQVQWQRSSSGLRDINLKVPPALRSLSFGPRLRQDHARALIARLWEAPDDCVLIDGRPIPSGPS